MTQRERAEIFSEVARRAPDLLRTAANARGENSLDVLAGIFAAGAGTVDDVIAWLTTSAEAERCGCGCENAAEEP